MKDKLRQHYKSLRSRLSKQTMDEYALSIFNNCNTNFDLTNKNISIFIPIEKFNEVNTWHFIDTIQADFYLPTVKNKTLTHIKYENKEQLKLSSWGILEPTYGTEVHPIKFDIVIVPLLAFDKKGTRVGYGAGFYDGFLKDCNPNCKFIGVSFFEPELKLIETYPTDIPLHYCVTPNQIVKF